MPGLRRSRAAGALAALAAAILIAALTAGPAQAAAPARAAGPTIGPVQIDAVGHPRLCWQAGGNGSGVTLERCDPAVAGQQWSLTSDGVLMNGNGYCLEAGPATPPAPALVPALALTPDPEPDSHPRPPQADSPRVRTRTLARVIVAV